MTLGGAPRAPPYVNDTQNPSIMISFMGYPLKNSIFTDIGQKGGWVVPRIVQAVVYKMSVSWYIGGWQKWKFLSSKRAIKRKHDKNSQIFRDIYSKFITFCNNFGRIELYQNLTKARFLISSCSSSSIFLKACIQWILKCYWQKGSQWSTNGLIFKFLTIKQWNPSLLTPL